ASPRSRATKAPTPNRFIASSPFLTLDRHSAPQLGPTRRAAVANLGPITPPGPSGAQIAALPWVRTPHRRHRGSRGRLLSGPTTVRLRNSLYCLQAIPPHIADGSENGLTWFTERRA